jgi:hypothetical protein
MTFVSFQGQTFEKTTLHPLAGLLLTGSSAPVSALATPAEEGDTRTVQERNYAVVVDGQVWRNREVIGSEADITPVEAGSERVAA